MKVFISWSGERSHKVALVFRDILPLILQYLVPYVSSEDINKGARWSAEIGTELAVSNFGIVCITKENLSAPWINFEAGALSKSLDKSLVFPFLFDLSRSEVTDGPITQFQSTINEKDDFLKLLKSINSACTEGALESSKIENVLEVWWPQIVSRLGEIEAPRNNPGVTKPEKDTATSTSTPSEAAKLDTILDLLVQQSRLLNAPDELFPESWYRRLSRSSGLDVNPLPMKAMLVCYRRLEQILDTNIERKPISHADIEEIRQAMSRPMDMLTARLLGGKWDLGDRNAFISMSNPSTMSNNTAFDLAEARRLKVGEGSQNILGSSTKRPIVEVKKRRVPSSPKD
jgi:hypothetical protein